MCECTAHRFHNIIRSVVFHFCVYIHGDLAVFVTCQILNCLRIYRRMNQVGDIGMTELVGGDFKIHAVNHFQ